MTAALARIPRPLLLALALLLGVSVVPLVSARAQEPPPPPAGGPVDGVQQSYNGARAGGGADEDVPLDTFFFHGARPDATFDMTAPTDGGEQTQTPSPGGDPQVPADPSAAFWAGPYAGTAQGELAISWFWDSPNPIALSFRVDAEVTVFADPDPESGEAQPERIIGRANISITPGVTGDPQENIHRIPVDGEVTDTLLVQVIPTFIDSGEQVTVHYDTPEPDFDAGFTLPQQGVDVPPAVPTSTPAEYDGEPLTVGTYYVGREAAEPTIGVDPEGRAFYAAGAFDALPEGSFANLARTEVLRSEDDGVTWTSVQPEVPSGATTIPPTTLDPYVYVEEDTGRVFNPELYGGCTYLQYSDDGGESYTTNPLGCGSFVNDHQTVFAGPVPEGSGLTTEDPDFPEIVYYCFNRIVDSSCGRSLDGGQNFTPSGEPAFLGFDEEAGGFCGGLHGHIATDPDGRLFLPKGHCGFPWVAVSEDAGATWEQVQVSDTVDVSGIQTSIDSDAAGNLYYVWWDAKNRLPYLATSTDHGQTWSEPLMVAPPGVNEVNWPVVAAGDEGRIIVHFPGTTSDDPDDPTRPWNLYEVVTTNALAADPLFVSTTANDPDDPVHRGDCNGRCAGMFDFLDAIVAPSDGAFWATMTDTCTPSIQGNPEDCVNEPGEDGNATDAEGYAVRQLSGPPLTGPLPQPAPTDAPTDAPTPTTSPAPTGEPSPPPTSEPSPAPREALARFGGGDRIATAVEISKATFEQADTVVLARSDEYADALTGSPLATFLEAPLLLSDREALSEDTAAEIERLGATDVILLGGTAALADQVASDLAARDVATRRIGGATRFGTAALIKPELPPSDEIFLTEGANLDPLRGWPDALSAAGLASTLRQPVLLTFADSLPGETADALDAAGDVTIVGGEFAVNAEVEDAVDGQVGEVRRIAGANRYETSALVADEALARDISPAVTWLATGLAFPDGLVAAAATGADDGVLLLVNGEDIEASPESIAWLTEHGDEIRAAKLAGGRAAINDAAEERIRALVE